MFTRSGCRTISFACLAVTDDAVGLEVVFALNRLNRLRRNSLDRWLVGVRLRDVATRATKCRQAVRDSHGRCQPSRQITEGITLAHSRRLLAGPTERKANTSEGMG